MRSAGMEMIVNDNPESTARLIYLGVPTFGRVSIRWHLQMLQLQSPLNRSIFHGVGIGFEVGQARNYLVQQALNMVTEHGHTVSHVFFVDDDVLIPRDALVNLLAHKRPIVSGLYYAKTAVPQPLVLIDDHGGGTVDLPEQPQLIECFAHGMGCTLIEIRVFRELLEQGKVDYEEVPAPPGQPPHRLPQFFKTTRDEHRIDQATGKPSIVYETEDVFFLRKAASIGYKAAVDTGVFCWHWDEASKRNYPLVAPRKVETPA